MRNFRLCYRIFLLLAGTLFIEIFLMGSQLVLAFANGLRIRWRNFIVQKWARLVALIVNMKVHARGQPPRPPFFLVSNHLSYIDIIAYFTQVHCIFIAKAELASWPLFGFLSKTANTAFIDRNNHKDIRRVNAVIE